MSSKSSDRLFSRMDPELRTILSAQKSIKQYAPNRTNIQLIRKGFTALTARWHNSPTMKAALNTCRASQPWSEHTCTILTRDNSYAMPVKIYRPIINGTANTVKLPVILLVHGGGGCLGGLDTDEFIAQYLSSRVKAVVVNIAYRLNPETKFPVPALDTYDAMVWIQTNAGLNGSELHDVDLSKGFIGCGVSAGGNLLGAALWLAALEEEKSQKTNVKDSEGKVAVVIPKLSGVMMLMTGYPFQGHDKSKDASLDLYPGICKSWKEFEDAPIANRATMPDYIDLAQVTPLTSPLFSPLNIPPSSTTLSHLPPRWYHQLSGLDPWRDSTLLWLSLLLHGKPELLDPKQGGRQKQKEFVTSLSAPRPRVKVDEYEGLPHTWWSVFPQVSRTIEWMEDLVQGAEWALKGAGDRIGDGRGVREAKL